MLLPVRMLGVVMVALAVLAGTAEAARTYKWVDENGVTHYSQYPPPKGEVQVIQPNIALPSGARSGTADAGEAGADGDGDGDGEGAQTMTEYCNQLRNQAQMLASERDVRVRHEDGTLRPLEGDARASRRAEVDQQIQQYCN